MRRLGPDGKIIYTNAGMFSNEGRLLGGRANGRGVFCIPAAHGNYHLSLNFGNDQFGGGDMASPQRSAFISLARNAPSSH